MKRLALVFPGQGTQKAMMCRDVYLAHASARAVFNRASDAAGYDLADVCFGLKTELLGRTEYAQPAILTCNEAVRSVLDGHGVVPDVLAGHSVGEFSALTAAGSLSFEESVSAVVERARLMASVTASGTMSAVTGLDEATVAALCDAVPELVQVGLFNGPRDVVVTGSTAGVEACEQMAKAAGATRVVRLAVSHAFHSELMREVLDRWEAVVDGLDARAPRIPVILNTTGACATDVSDIRKALVDQLIFPVRWTDSLRTMARLGVRVVVETGASKTLCRLVRSFDRAVDALTCVDARQLARAVTTLTSAGVSDKHEETRLAIGADDHVLR